MATGFPTLRGHGESRRSSADGTKRPRPKTKRLDFSSRFVCACRRSELYGLYGFDEVLELAVMDGEGQALAHLVVEELLSQG